MSLVRLRRLGIAATVASMLSIAVVGTIQAHVLKDFGPYSVALGWVVEPTYVGQVNAVQVVVKDKAGQGRHRPGGGRPQGRRQRRRSGIDGACARQQVRRGHRARDRRRLRGAAHPDVARRLHLPSDRQRSMARLSTRPLPRATRRSTRRSRRPTSSSPTKLPSLTEITTSLDRITARLSASPSPGASAAAPAPSARADLTGAVTAAQATASQARDAASSALIVGLAARSPRGDPRWCRPGARRPSASRGLRGMIRPRASLGVGATGLALVVLVALAGPAGAHALPQSSSPSAGATPFDVRRRR